MSTETRPHPPSVDQVLAATRERLGAEGGRRHEALVEIARTIITEERARLAGGEAGEAGEAREPRSAAALGEEVAARLDAIATVAILATINATGVIVHTNLGRAPWPAAAIEAARAAASGYLLLELDRESGRRGPRFRAAEEHLISLSGAEDALVTNNNAAALVLAVGLARRRGVVVSRGELLEIGGGVRIPEIIRRGGGRLVEVGTTNRTRVADFEEPLAGGRASVVLRVHASNFRQDGFIESPDPTELAALAHRHAAIVVDDLGSGALLPTERYGLAHEPMPDERLAAGADLVTFSGDKLVGGPQAGFIVGREELVRRIRKDPLARAMRPDKVTLAAVAATLGLYRAGRAETDVPVWRMITTDPAVLRSRAVALAGRLGERARVIATEATVGGGSLPGETLPSFGVAVDVERGERARGGAAGAGRGAAAEARGSTRGGAADRLLAALRQGRPSVVGRIADGRVVLDLRTVDPAADGDLVAAALVALG